MSRHPADQLGYMGIWLNLSGLQFPVLPFLSFPFFSFPFLSLHECSVMSDSLWPPWTAACQVPLSIGFSEQECWTGLPFPSWGDLPNPEFEPASSALAGRFFTTGLTWEAPLVKELLKGHTTLTESLWGLHEMMHVTCLAQSLTRSSPRWRLITIVTSTYMCSELCKWRELREQSLGAPGRVIAYLSSNSGPVG